MIFFVNISSTITSNLDQNEDICLPTPLQNSFVFREITREEIILVTKQMTSNKSVGHDEIPVNILKANIDILSYPLQATFNQPFMSGVFPDHLKVGRVVPIYKGDYPNNVENYRPITVLPAVTILFKKLIARRIIEFIEKYQILASQQHGFRKHFSTSTAVHSVTEIVHQALGKGQIAAGIFLDIKKAFDCVDYNILLNKLDRYGFRGPASSFFRSYLTSCKQFVDVLGEKSTMKDVKSGVPQGSVLGPILFSLFVNDYATSLTHAKAILYADDTALLISCNSVAEAQTLASEDLARTLRWFNTNKLVLNIKKTKFLIFSSRQKHLSHVCNLKVDGKALCQVDAYKYLGVTLDSSIHWAQHIKTVCQKLSFGCFTLIQARKHLTETTLRQIYFSIFHSHLTYCVESWGYTYKSYCTPINILQKRAVRIIASAARTAQSSPIFKQLNIMHFNKARDYKTAILIKRVISTNTPYH